MEEKTRLKQGDLSKILYYRIPKELVRNKIFEGLSLGAKLLYGIMLDRTDLSERSNWINENDEIYIYYKIEEIEKDLNVSKNTALKYLKELIENELLDCEKQGANKPNLYFLKTIILESSKIGSSKTGSPKIEPRKSKNCTQEVQKLNPNKNYLTNTYLINQDIKRNIKEKEKKKTYGKYQRIKLTDKEYENLIELYGKELIEEKITKLDEYVESNNNKNKYTNFNLVIQRAIRERWWEEKTKQPYQYENETTKTIKAILNDEVTFEPLPEFDESKYLE